MKIIVTLYILALFASQSLYAHPSHYSDAYSNLTHSHTGLEYLILAIIILALAVKLIKHK